MNIKNKPSFRILIFFGLVLFGCSPKVVTTVPTKPVTVNLPPTTTKVDKPVKRFTEANISLLIPFKLNQLNLQTATKAEIEKSSMALDFYQGIILGIDSAAATGLDFKLNVFDTRDENSQIETLVKKETLKNSNLIIGPVFPEGVKYISKYAIANDLAIVSPLAATKPSDFNTLPDNLNNLTHLYCQQHQPTRYWHC